MSSAENDRVPTPAVSVGMPVYNSEAHIGDSLTSILTQSSSDFELIISDNASDDGTERICREFAERDARIRYIRNARNVGASDNYNAVCLAASGKYFKWASSNDLCKETFLEKCVAVLDARPDVVLCYPRTRLFASESQPAEDYRDDLHLEDETPTARFGKVLENMRLNNIMNGVIRTEALRRTGLIKTFYFSDRNLMAELALHGKFFEVPEFLFYRRMDEQTATKLKSHDETVRHYDPEMKNPMVMQEWKAFAEYHRAVWRAPLGVWERIRLIRYLGKQMRWSRRRLGRDVSELVGRTVRGTLGASKGSAEK